MTKKDLLAKWSNIETDRPANEDKYVPFLEDYLQENEVTLPIISEICVVIAVKSGKGYLLVCEDFTVFSFKKSKLSTLIVEALKVFVERGNGHRLAVIVTSISKEGKPTWNISANKEDDPITYYMDDEGKKFSTYPLTNTDKYVDAINPLL